MLMKMAGAERLMSRARLVVNRRKTAYHCSTLIQLAAGFLEWKECFHLLQVCKIKKN